MNVLTLPDWQSITQCRAFALALLISGEAPMHESNIPDFLKVVDTYARYIYAGLPKEGK